MKVLIVTSSAPFGRGESFVVAEANDMARAGASVFLFPAVIRRGTPNDFQLHDNCRLITRKGLFFRTLGMLLKYFLTRPMLTLQVFKSVVSHSLGNTVKNWVIIPRALWIADYLKGNPVDHIHAHWLTTPATLAMIVGKITGITWSATGHRGDIVADNLLSEKFEQADFIRFISDNGMRLAKERASLDLDKAHVVHLGVNVPLLDTSRRRDSESRTDLLTILCPASLSPVKGHEFFFSALANLKNRSGIEVIIAGEGELQETLIALANKLNISSIVRFKGHVPHAKLLSWYKNSQIDLVVLPSQDLGGGLHEGIPVSLMEAMAYGVPVISTQTGGIPELLRGKEGQLFGGLVDPRDKLALAQLLDQLIESPRRRCSLGASGYERVSEEFNREKTVDELMDLMNLQGTS
jgi:glycosyltransferase involved in cell wall biosynthesis